jgi:hypothetical protein
LTYSRISIAVLFSIILLLPMIIDEYQEQQPEQMKGDNQLTEIQERTLAEARDSGVRIGWEKQIQSVSDGYDQGEAIAVDSSGNAFVSGMFCSLGGITLGSTTLERIGICDMFLAKMAPNGYWYWAIQIGGADSRILSRYHTISIASDGGVFLSGYSNASSLTLGSITVYNSHSPTQGVVLAKASSSGEWLWGKMIAEDEGMYSKSVQSTSDGGVVIAGIFYSNSISFGSHIIYNTNASQSDAFVAKSDSDGNWLWANSAGSTEWDGATDMTLSSSGTLTVIGEYNDQIEFGQHSLQSSAPSSIFISTISSSNGSWMSSTSLDSDYVKVTGITNFPQGDIAITGYFRGTLIIGSTTLESTDESSDIFVSRMDSDGNWIWAVSTGGTETDCSYDIVSGAFGRLVIVGHYLSPSISFGNKVLTNADQWDANWDLYVAWLDSDGNWEGAVGASGSDMDKLKAVDIHSNGMVYVTGRTNSTSLEIGLDERSTSGYEDMFVALLDVDSDGDEIGDGRDSFPNDSTQQSDRDNDGYGDNEWGNDGDAFPDDSTQYHDSDGDGYGDNEWGNNADDCPTDSTQWLDSDGDGYCDSQLGYNPDKFPNDSTQWRDSDNDGYGDNPSGNNPDAFANDATQHSDSDGDGYGDSSYGNNPDAFRYESTQWRDSDDDGYGDNPNGVDGDMCLGTSSEERRYVDENGCGESQRDTDNDGVNDSLDICDNTLDRSTTNLEGCSAYQRDFDGDGLVDALDPCPDSVENLCLEAAVGIGEKDSSTEAGLLWGSFGLLVFIAILLLIMMFRKGKEENSAPIVIEELPEWK